MGAQGVILIVEDEDAIRLTLRDYLKKKGYEVKHLLDNRVDLIVSDYRMNVLGGDYWIKFLHTFCADKKVFITSGFLRPDFSIPFPVLYKPFDYGKLAEMIAATLDTEKNGDG